MIYTVYNGCAAIATYQQKTSAIKRAKKQMLFNLIEEIESEITVTAKRYATDPSEELIYTSYEEE